MTPEQFCYWLQGRSELLPEQAPTPEEWQSIREHLATVFKKVTPPVAPHGPAMWPPVQGAGTPIKPLTTECSVRTATALTYC